MSLQDPLKIRREVMGKEKQKKPRQREILTSLVYRYSSLHLSFRTDFWWGILSLYMYHPSANLSHRGGQVPADLQTRVEL